MGVTRLVTILGLGPKKEFPHYRPTVYRIGVAKSRETPLVARAYCDLVEGIESIVVFATKEVKERWFDTKNIYKIINPEENISIRPVDIGSGRSRQELLDLFDKVAEELTEEPRGGESGPPERIILDVTHGFRILPIFSMAALSFVISSWQRRGIANPPHVKVMYGAHDAQDNSGVTPIWDLTEFVNMARWNSALNALMRYGRADDIELLARDERKTLWAELSGVELDPDTKRRLGAIERLGKAAKQFADDLALNRLQHLLANSAPRLRKELTSEYAGWLSSRMPMLSSALAELRQWVEPLCAEKVMNPEGLKASGYLVELLSRLQRYSELAAVLREGLITHFALVKGLASCGEPGNAFNKMAREDQERSWNEFCGRNMRGNGEDSPLLRNAKMASSVAGLRNDVEHCGLNAEPTRADRLRKKLDELAGEFKELVSGEITVEAGPTGEAAGKKVFVNLSNHLVATWSAEQLEAARRLDLGEPVDFEGGMPQVPPEADEEAIERLAGEVAERARAMGAAGAFVASDFTFTFALVARLKRYGIRCFASTTERRAEDIPRSNGTIEHHAIIKFVRWREYK